MTQKNELKEGDVVLATKEEEFWINVKDDTGKQIEAVNKQLKFLEAVFELANQKIKDEQDKN